MLDPCHETLQLPVNPLLVTEESDVKVTLRKPVSELYWLLELSDPDCLRIRSLEVHASVSHR